MKIQNKILSSAVSIALTAMSANIYADTTEDLVNALVTKGILTEDEGNLLSKAHEKKMKNTPIIKNKGGKFSLMSADEKNEIALTGRMHFDVAASSVNENDVAGNVDSDYSSSANYGSYDRDAKSVSSDGEYEMRRARIGLKGKLDGIWKYSAVLDPGNKKGGLDEFWLAFAPNKEFNITAGQFKQAFNLEGITSSNDIDMMERSFINQISPHKKLGIGISGEPTKGMTYQVTRYQENINNDVIEAESNYSGRLTYDFASANGMKDSIFHVGLSGFTEDYAQTPTTSSNGTSVTTATTHAALFNFRSSGRGISPIASLQLSGAYLTGGGASEKGKVAVNVESKFYGLEAIVAKGPFKVQAEWAKGDFDGSDPTYGNQASADISTGYLTGGWLLTGETYAKAYKGGKMGGLKPNTPFDMESGKGIGLFEITARYQRLSISDISAMDTNGTYTETRWRGMNPTASTSAESYTTCAGNCSTGANQFGLGLKWVANENVMFKVDYERTNFDDALQMADIGGSTTTDTIDKENFISARMQYAF